MRNPISGSGKKVIMKTDAIDILIAEDDRGFRELVFEVLVGSGYHVDVAPDGASAWKLLNERSYRLLVTDFRMPIMNGFELVLETKKCFPHTKVIMLSGDSASLNTTHLQETICHDGHKVRIDLFMRKPVVFAELLNSVERVLGYSAAAERE